MPSSVATWMVACLYNQPTTQVNSAFCRYTVGRLSRVGSIHVRLVEDNTV